jgi:hypothetical protein
MGREARCGASVKGMAQDNPDALGVDSYGLMSPMRVRSILLASSWPASLTHTELTDVHVESAFSDAS